MSDTSQGVGWWQASDGKWYPPQEPPVPPPVPSPAAPSPAATPSQPTSERSNKGLLIGLAVCLSLFALVLIAGAIRRANKNDDEATAASATTIASTTTTTVAKTTTTTTDPVTTTTEAPTTTTTPPTTTIAAPPNQPTITLDEFNALQNGMTRNQAAAIVGSAGELYGEAGNPGGRFYTVTVTWDGEGVRGGYASASFTDDKLVSKTQYGLN